MPTAWDLIGTPNLVRIKGGRTTYETVENYGGERVKLSRLDTKDGLRQVSRYVGPDTPMEIVPEDVRLGARVIVDKLGGERVEGVFDGWFGIDSTGETTGLQVLVSRVPHDLRFVALDELVRIEEDSYA